MPHPGHQVIGAPRGWGRQQASRPPSVAPPDEGHRCSDLALDRDEQSPDTQALATGCLPLTCSSFPEKEDQKDSAEEMRKFKKSRARAKKARVAVRRVSWGCSGSVAALSVWLPLALCACVDTDLIKIK